MARFSSLNVLTPSGAIGAGESFSNSVKTEAARDARVFVDVTAIAGGATLDVQVQISPDNTTWFDAEGGAFNQIVAVGSSVLAMAEEKISTWLRLKYNRAGGAITASAKLEVKQGV